MKFEWENIFDLGLIEKERTLTMRAKVFGGWIVKSIYYLEKKIRNETMVFVTDVNHEWEVDK